MKARLFALLALLVVPAWAATQDATPFHLLEGREVARSLPVRDFEAALFAWLADGMLALDAEGPVHLDLRGRVVDRLDPCPAAKDAEAVEL